MTNSITGLKGPKDWSPKEFDSMMTLEPVEKAGKKAGKVHDVKYYNDDNGHGLTACGLRVYPWTVTHAGLFTCKKCQKVWRKDRN